MKITQLPSNDKTNGWSRILAPREATPSLEGDISADWVVLGAGYAGLAAANRLAENCPNDKIALVDAGEVGENASGRNSGFGIDLPHTVGSSLDELEQSHAYMRLARAALAHLEDRMTTAGFDCDWAVRGKYQTAVTTRGKQEMLVPFAAELDRLGEPYQWIEGDELAAKIGTRHFASAVYTPGCILMNPAALTKGLADSLPGNVTLYENSPITQVDYRNGVQLISAGGSIRAPKMILAANGFSEHFGFMQGKFIHLAAHASLSRPLTEAEQAAYGVTEPWGVTPANAFGGITMRYTNDRRLLIRERIEYCPRQSVTVEKQRTIARHHKVLFDDRFPMLPDVTMEHTWTGFLALSRNSAPAFGQMTRNIWIAAGQNGIGVTKGTFSGMLAADLATGRDNPLIEDMLGLGTPADLPPAAIAAVGIRARLGWEKWRNRHEE